MTPNPVEQLVSINSQIVEYIEVLLTLGGVLALAYVLLRIGLPRVMRVRSSGAGPIQILSRCALGPKNTLYLVKVGSQVSLIASWENGVTFLTAIAPENVESVSESQRSVSTTPIDTSLLPWRRKTEKER
jgi:flagellar biogenesis protein FliO